MFKNISTNSSTIQIGLFAIASKSSMANLLDEVEEGGTKQQDLL
jgi:hypothetical protein